MSRLFDAIRADQRPAFATTLSVQLLVAASILSLLVLWLTALGRPFLCPCGTVSLWVGDVRSSQASQQFSDWYALLHLVFGLGLFVFLDWMKPNWSTGQKLLVAIASSAAWEAVENLPFVIALFGQAEGAPPYEGDSVLNAVADTAFVVAGFFVASALPLAAVIAVATALEILVWRMAGDGYALGTLRLIGVPV